MAGSRENCSMCGVLMRECVLPLSRDAYNHRLCSLCYIRNCSTEVSDDMFGCCHFAEDSQGLCRIEYLGVDNPIVALVCWGGVHAVHLADLAPTTTGYDF